MLSDLHGPSRASGRSSGPGVLGVWKGLGQVSWAEIRHQGREQMWEACKHDYAPWKLVFHLSLPSPFFGVSRAQDGVQPRWLALPHTGWM